MHVRNVVLGLPLLVCTSFQHKFPTLLCAKMQSYPTKRQKDNIQNRAFHWEKITFTVAFFIFVLHSFPLSFFFFWGGEGGEGGRGSSQLIWDTRRVGTQKFIIKRRGHRILQELPVKSHQSPPLPHRVQRRCVCR